MSGVAEVRAGLAAAQEKLTLNGTRTVLFIDEIHRFNKSQQDALLPHVEDGTVTLIGATTENPYFEVNSALLSRLRVWRLEPLTDEDVGRVVRSSLEDAERGLAGALGPEGGVALGDEAFDHLVSIAAGDARAALNVLEGAVALAEGEDIRDKSGHVAPRLADIEGPPSSASSPTTAPATATTTPSRRSSRAYAATIPMRAVYWLAAMIAAGEDPKFIARRLIISAARTSATPIRGRCRSLLPPAQALDWIGLPEAQYALAQAATYIATAPKSNRAGLAYFSAAGDVEGLGSLSVPLHLRSAGDRRMKHHGIGVGYLYPHDYEGADVEQQYLPEELGDKRYYLPLDQGYEATIGERMARREAARAAAREAGKTPRIKTPGPVMQPKAGAGIQRTREENRKKLPRPRSATRAASRDRPGQPPVECRP